MEDRPKLTIGLPVRNGENFLALAIESLLSQTFTDFELLISDNASEDSTWKICQNYASGDPRIRTHRFEENQGATKNFNYVFEKSRTPYFKWAAHDDLCSSVFLDRCMLRLDEDPDAVLAHSLNGRIYADGSHGKQYPAPTGVESEDMIERFRSLVWKPHRCIEVFGVIRSDILRKSALIGNYAGSDRVLLAELGLLGKFSIVPEVLFFRRSHDRTSLAQYPVEEERIAWFDPGLAGRPTFPVNRGIREYMQAIQRAVPESEQEACRQIVMRWVREGVHYSGKKVSDLLKAEKARWERMQAGRGRGDGI